MPDKPSRIRVFHAVLSRRLVDTHREWFTGPTELFGSRTDHLQLCAKDDDWTFSIKALVLIDAAMIELLVACTDEKLRNCWERIQSGGGAPSRTQALSDLKLLRSEHRTVIHKLADWRNKTAHSLKAGNFSFEESYRIAKVAPDDRFCDALDRAKSPFADNDKLICGFLGTHPWESARAKVVKAVLSIITDLHYKTSTTLMGSSLTKVVTDSVYDVFASTAPELFEFLYNDPRELAEEWMKKFNSKMTRE